MSATPDRFEQLTGPFDRPVAPSPAFAERLRLTVQERAGGSIAATNEDRTSIRETPTQIPTSRRHPAAGRGTRWSSRIAAAVLVLLLAGLAISLARLQTTSLTRQHDVGDGNSGKPVPTTPAFDGNWGGGIGHTWAFNLPAFGTGQVTIGQGGETSSLASAQSVVTNGELIVSLHPMAPDGPATLEAFTLTGNPRWQVSIGAMPGMAIDNDRLYIIRDNAIDGDGTRPLTAISLETGDVLWTGPDLASTGKATWGWSPIVANGVVYVANQKGGAYALDAQTGKQLWEAPIADDAAPKRADGSSDTQTGGSIALGKDGLFVAGWTNTIRQIDPATGKVLATISLDPGMRELDLALRDRTLVVKANVMVDDVPQSALVAIDTSTNAIRWTKETPTRIDDNMVVLEDRVIVTRVDQGNIPTLNVDAYMLATGELHTIPMPMLETAGASLSAIDGLHPLLFIVSAESALTVVDVNTGAVVGTQAAPETPPEIRFRQLPVIILGGDAPVFVQPNGTWFRIGPD